MFSFNHKNFVKSDFIVSKNPAYSTYPMEDTLTPGAISKILTGECREIIDLKPVVQVMDIIKCIRTLSEVFDDEVLEVEEWYAIVLSDGSVFEVHVIIEDKINELIKAKQLVKGSIVQLTKFYTWKPREITYVLYLLVMHS